MVTPLVLQQQARATLHELDDSLSRQQGQLAVLQTENERLSKQAAGSVLSSNQVEELDRLRTEAAVLQQQTGAAAELREENRRLKASVSKPPTPLQQQEEAITMMLYSKDWVLAFILFAEKHQDQFPTDFEQAKDFLPQRAKAETNVTTDRFEIVYQGKWTDIKNPMKTVVLREKHARQSLDGKWNRAYGFADGHSEIHTEANGNFDAWEKEHILEPAAPGQ
jgi:hypothetical protein